MRKVLLLVLIITAVNLGLLSLKDAQAHGDPVVSVSPTIVPAGGEVTVSGTEMEDGEVFVISLEGSTRSIRLGEATASGEGFEVTLVIPPDTPAGSYRLQAATGEETAIADLEVTSAAAGEDNAVALEPSAEPMDLARPRNPITVVATAAVGLLSLILGVWLVRR
jgi:hypothetical protein